MAQIFVTSSIWYQLNDVNCRILRYQQKLLRNQNNFCKCFKITGISYLIQSDLFVASHYKILFTVHYCTDESPLSITSSLWSVRKNRVTCEIHSHCTFASAWTDPVCKIARSVPRNKTTEAMFVLPPVSLSNILVLLLRSTCTLDVDIFFLKFSVRPTRWTGPWSSTNGRREIGVAVSQSEPRYSTSWSCWCWPPGRPGLNVLEPVLSDRVMKSMDLYIYSRIRFYN